MRGRRGWEGGSTGEGQKWGGSAGEGGPRGGPPALDVGRGQVLGHMHAAGAATLPLLLLPLCDQRGHMGAALRMEWPEQPHSIHTQPPP